MTLIVHPLTIISFLKLGQIDWLQTFSRTLGTLGVRFSTPLKIIDKNIIVKL